MLTALGDQPLVICANPLALTRKFFDRSVHKVAPDLIGATLLVDGVGGVIVEVEAYHHTDPAAHSFRGPTARNAVMFGPPGFAYVYRSYGIHWCLNFVCEREGLGQRGADPAHRADRRAGACGDGAPCRTMRRLCSGPGKLCQALGVTIKHKRPAARPPPFEQARGGRPKIVTGPRIGITKAVEKPWRYGMRDSVSE